MAADAPLPVRRLALIGLGHIGSSISHAARRAGLATAIAGHDASPAVRARALALGLVQEAPATAAEAVAGADLVFLCTPPGAFGAVMREIAPALAPGAILTDVGSFKTAAIEAIAPLVPPGVRFVPGHPIAGTEHSGPDSGFAELFDGRWALLTPLPDSDASAVETLTAFWRACGANVATMAPERHDLVLAVTSHVPHLIAYCIVGTADDLEAITRQEVIKYSAGGFRDFTRIAASDPDMWRDIFLNNRDAVLEVLGRFTEDLFMLQRSVRAGDGEALHAFFTRTRAIRRGIVAAGQDSPEADFGRHARK